MSVEYTRINWEDTPSTQTPLNAENLNAMDSAIDDLAGAVNDLDGVTDDIEALETDVDELKNDFTNLSEKVDSAFVVETATGSIASFTDGADDVPVKDLQVAIEPVQSGSGDPSPSNVRPISGWTGANVTRTGKNLLTQNAKWYYNDHIFFGNHTNNNMPDGTFILPAGTYTASSSETMTGIYTFDETGTSCGLVYNNTKLTFVNPKTQKFLVKFYKASTTEQEFANINLQLEVGSTATAYEPYQGETYEVDWTTEAGTVYGGTLDVTTGVLTVDRAYKLLNGVDDSVVSYRNNGQSAITTRAYVSIANKAFGGANIISSEFYTSATNADVVGLMVGRPASNGVEFYLDISVPDTIDGVKAWFANNPAQVVYELATPQTYQLTPQEVSTILGQNNIFADTGNVTVQYRADTKLYIDKVLNA